MIHQTSMLHGLSTLRGYWVCVETNMRLWPMGKTLKWSYIPYELGHCSWKLVTINILNKGTMTSHGIETTYSLSDIQRTCDHEICGCNNYFSKIWHILLRVRWCLFFGWIEKIKIFGFFYSVKSNMLTSSNITKLTYW